MSKLCWCDELIVSGEARAVGQVCRRSTGEAMGTRAASWLYRCGIEEFAMVAIHTGNRGSFYDIEMNMYVR